MCVLFGFVGHTFGTNTPIKSIGGGCCDDDGISLTQWGVLFGSMMGWVVSMVTYIMLASKLGSRDSWSDIF